MNLLIKSQLLCQLSSRAEATAGCLTRQPGLQDPEADEMTKRTKAPRKGKSTQDAKPYPEFPLTAHPTGRWCKKHRGKQHYFGPLDDWQGALERFKREWSFITQGKTPPAEGSDTGCTLRVLCNAFLNTKRRAMEAGELAPRSFHEYRQTTDALIGHFGKDRRVDDLQPVDFEKFRAKLATKYSTASLKNKINGFRMVFKYAHDQRLIDSPVNYGQSFNRPSAKSIRKARNEAGPKLFEADELHRILEACDPIMRAMVLLGANAGFGNADVANLPRSAIDLDSGWIEFPRVKTEIPRRVPLWPETGEALREALDRRPRAADATDDGMVFLTSQGNRWTRIQPSKADPNRMVPVDALSQKFAKLLKSLEINGRNRLNFYTLRHIFETIGGESKDQVAVNAIMGHVDPSMAAVYRERIADERLHAVVDVVRRWLWPELCCAPKTT